MGTQLRRILPLCTVAALAAGCATAGPAASPPASSSMADSASPVSTAIAEPAPSETAESMPNAAATTMASSNTSAIDTSAVDTSAGVRQRCLEALSTLDRRVDNEDFEFPDEGPELSEEELQRTLLPAVEYVDGVAAPDDRPSLDVMPDYDAETIPILDLDLFVGNCFEFGFLGDDDDEVDDE
ncbi:MAG: hypothetical protein AAGA42_00950 [Actinomycetota bacterium]